MRTFCIYGILIYLAAINIAAFFLYGKLGGYAYGIELKRQLLELEKNPTETFTMRTRCERK